MENKTKRTIPQDAIETLPKGWVILGWGGEFKDNGILSALVNCYDNETGWEDDPNPPAVDFNMKQFLYAAPKDSEIARLNGHGKKRIYIAGPMRGIKWYNFGAFEDAERKLQDDYEVVSPVKIDQHNGFDAFDLPFNWDWSTLPEGLNLKEIIDRDLEALKTCDAIYMLEGWENSTGAQAELALARWMGLDIVREVTYQGPSGTIEIKNTQNPSKEAPEDVLEEALRITGGDRMAAYGPPDQDFRRTANMWNELFSTRIEDGKLCLKPSDVAWGMILLKASRNTHSPKRDNFTDAAGYARCGFLCDEADGTINK